MSRVKAMKQIDQMLQKDFKYLYKRQSIDINAWHFTFIMDCKTHTLQMGLNFDKNWCDILAFISPTTNLIPSNNENYWEALRTVNFINWNIKSCGRFYIDDYGDLAYSLRITYRDLEDMPQRCIKEIECAVDYYADLFIPLLNVCQGRSSYEKTKLLIDDMWNHPK